MGNQGQDMSMAIYKNSNFTGGCLEIRLFYVRITPCAVETVPDHLILRHLRREMGVTLEINSSRIPANDTGIITLRRDRVDKESSEVTFVSTDSVRVSGPVEFEVHENENELILCGSLERVETTWANGNVLENDSRSGWSMDCYTAASFGNGGSAFFQPKFGVSLPSIEVYIAGCCSGVPVILSKTIQVSPRRKLPRQGMLDAIPEDEEVAKEQGSSNGFGRQIKPLSRASNFAGDSSASFVWLVAAATIATESIRNAAVMARYNAEIRVKEALVAKAEAAEVLKRFNNLLNNHGHQFGNDAGGSKIHEEEGCSSRFPNADDDTFVD